MEGLESRKLLAVVLILVVAATMIIAASDDNCGELCLAEPGGLSLSQRVSVSEAIGLIQANEGNPDFVILDVRTSSEYAAGHIESAMNLDYYSNSFQHDLGMLDKEKTYLVYCLTGYRSGLAMDMMEDLGFEYVYGLSGGVEDWQFHGWPLATPEKAG